jgi:DNA (cytosine-5)-methyltransferase 1
MARIIGEVRPRFAFVENSPMLTTRGLDVVLGDLASLGYDAEWCVLGADDAGAPHIRKRIWVLAYAIGEQHQSNTHEKRWPTSTELSTDTDRNGEHAVSVDAKMAGSSESVADSGSGRGPDNKLCAGRNVVGVGCPELADSNSTGRKKQRSAVTNGQKHAAIERGSWWSSEPALGRVAHGVAHRVDRLTAIGNGQVPAVAALAWQTLMTRIKDSSLSPSAV